MVENEVKEIQASSNIAQMLTEFRVKYPYNEFRVENIVWDYISCGKGEEAILFLTGGVGTAEGWFLHILNLENDYQVVAIDYPPVSSMKKLCSGIISLLETENIVKVHIIGHSLGGMVAQAFLYHYPDHVNNLILSHTTGNLPNFGEKSRMRRMRRLKKNIRVLKFIPMWLFRSYLLKSSNKSLQNYDPLEAEAFKPLISEILRKSTRKQLISKSNVMFDFLKNYTFTAESFSTWTGNVLILESHDDESIDSEERDALKLTFKDAKVHTFHGTGHTSIFNKRDETISLIKEFLMK
ncbi:MAG: alpha/beta fold hydrolase [Candidatus Hermodarchaeota archaeon]